MDLLARAKAQNLPDAFSLSGVTFGYTPETPVVRNIAFDVTAGQSVALLGANGSGKSTLLKLLDGLLFPQSGTIMVFGEALTEAALRDERFRHGFRRRVGFVFQNSDAQLFSPTVREELAFGPLQLGLTRRDVETRVRDMAILFRLHTLLDRAPFHLSGGEKKRVALASVLTINPDVILLDEPTAGLDPRSRTELVALLSRLEAAGKTLVTATHDLDIVPRIAQSALVFSEQGELAAQGTCETILADRPLLAGVNLME